MACDVRSRPSEEVHLEMSVRKSMMPRALGLSYWVRPGLLLCSLTLTAACRERLSMHHCTHP